MARIPLTLLLSGCVECGFTVGDAKLQEPLPDCLPIEESAAPVEYGWDGDDDEYCALGDPSYVESGSANILAFSIEGETGLNPGSKPMRLREYDSSEDETYVSADVTADVTTGHGPRRAAARTATASAPATSVSAPTPCS